jgi:signal transduction histidine kinase
MPSLSPPSGAESSARPAVYQQVHPAVRLYFLVRLVAYPLFMLAYGVHMRGRVLPAWALVLFLAHTFIFPHVARRVAARNNDPKRAEQRNLLLDSFLIGCYVPVTGFSLWPNTASILGLNAGMINLGGPRLALRGLLSWGAGVIVAGTVTGFQTDVFSASRLTQVLSITLIGMYTTVFGLQSFVQLRRVKRANVQIREQNAQIEAHTALLQERSAELELALAKAKESDEAKSNFLATMSHELRTPLNSIIGFTNIVLRNKGGQIASQDVVYLRRVSSSGAHLLELINGVLDLAKIEAREMDLERVPVDLLVLARETLSQFEPQAEAQAVQLFADLPRGAVLVADRARLKQILINLVGNAVKFTRDGAVTLRIVLDPLTGAPARLDVIDTGIGINDDRLAAIFEAFQQADTTTSRQYGGTGLGLSITRSLVVLMGWQITVTSTVGVGSTFSLIFQPESGAERRQHHQAA